MEILNAFFNGYFKQKTAETGRSMVEILGVLAVMGVLSAGGIYGYTFAMDKYRANDIIYEVNLRNRDTWNKYQDKDLPEAEELDEWADTTQTGFPIGVYPRSNIVFDVQVDDVPSRVCKQVLNMNIEGPMFIWTPAEDGKKQIFNGNASELCGDDIETSIVFTTSLDSYGQDEGLREGATDENGRPIRYCLDDDDCFSCQTCDVGTYTCQSTCPDATPICHSTLQQCVACEDNSDCASNQICSEYNEETGESQVCVTVEETCAEGEFRSQNGACIPCDYPANVLIKPDETFMNDTGTGKELCLACPNSRRVEGNGEKMYCSKYCTNGFSFADTDTTCQACTNEKGTWSLVSSSENIRKCLDCSKNHYNFSIHTGAIRQLCSNETACAPDEYFFPTKYKSCYKCDHSVGSVLGFAYFNYQSNITLPDRKTSCEACPDTPTTKRWWVQYGKNDGYMSCFPVCEQPEETCADKTAQTCKRKFQGTNTTCYSCDDPNMVHVGLDTGLHKLCTDCKREVNGEYCILRDTCSETQFRGIDGKCYNCSETKPIHVLNETDSQCATNCSTYTTGNYTGREIINGYSDQTLSVPFSICRLKCKEKDDEGNKLFQGLDGQCNQCDTEDNIAMSYTDLSGLGYIFISKSSYNDIECNLCNTEDENGNLVKVREAYSSSCDLYQTCNGFRDTEGRCWPCTTTEPKSGVTEAECNKCPTTHIWMKGWPGGGGTSESCIFVEPGVTGVCNDIGNADFPAYNDSGNKMLRDNFGICHDCDTPSVVHVGHPTYGNHNRGTAKQQCVHCKNRHYDNYGSCYPGLCSDGITFINIGASCTECTTTTALVEIPVGVATEDNCISCEGKRVMKTGSTDDKNLKAYCVKKCVSGEFQKTDGKCYTGSNDYGTIGSDEQSKTLCRESGRIAFSKQNNGVTDWYCSQTTVEGEHFIGITGQRVACTAGDTQIPDSQDARNLCTQCSNRFVETVDDKIMCRQ